MSHQDELDALFKPVSFAERPSLSDRFWLTLVLIGIAGCLAIVLLAIFFYSGVLEQ